MLNQFPSDAVGIALLIVAMLLLAIFNFLAVRWVESKQLAQKKKVACFFLGVLGVLMFLLVLHVWSWFAGLFNGWIHEGSFHWPNPSPLVALGPIMVFLLYILLTRWLIEANWKNCVLISLLALLLLSLFLTFIPYAADALNFGIV